MHRIVHTSKSPFEIVVLLVLVLAGTSGLVSPDASSHAVAAILPIWGQYVWYSGLIAGGSVSLVGALTNRMWALFTERGGLLTLGVLCVVYTAIVIAVAGLTAAGVAFSGALTLGLGVAFFIRARQITLDIKRVDDGGGL
jgi:uncharacterized membrane protein